MVLGGEEDTSTLLKGMDDVELQMMMSSLAVSCLSECIYKDPILAEHPENQNARAERQKQSIVHH